MRYAEGNFEQGNMPPQAPNFIETVEGSESAQVRDYFAGIEQGIFDDKNDAPMEFDSPEDAKRFFATQGVKIDIH